MTKYRIREEHRNNGSITYYPEMLDKFLFWTFWSYVPEWSDSLNRYWECRSEFKSKHEAELCIDFYKKHGSNGPKTKIVYVDIK